MLAVYLAEELLQQNHPLPSLRTLRRKLENWKFESGNPEEILLFLQAKEKNMNEIDKICLLIIEEVHITKGLQYDPATGSYIGYVTLPNHDFAVEADRVLVIMIAGIASRWKQVIDYFYADSHSDGTMYNLLIKNYIEKIHKINFYVLGVLSDMGGPNQGM